MINPYFLYSLSFSICILSYLPGWSNLYPPLSAPLTLFIVASILLHLILAIYWKQKVKLSFPTSGPFFNPVAVTIFIYLLWIADFIYEGGIPLLKILFHQPYNYRLFGVPSLHVFTVTFASFYTVFLIYHFIITGKRVYFYLFLINLFAGLLIFSRAMLIFNILSSVFIYLIISTTFSRKHLLLLISGCIVILYLFGVLGNLRSSFEEKKEYNADRFLVLGYASPAFHQSIIPKEFFWGYIYLSSPLANLQQNINTFPLPPLSPGRLAEQINNEMLPDFISKRINAALHIQRERENTLPKKPFNVSTVYSRSYSYLGWSGIIMMAIFLAIFPLLYLKLIPRNTYALTGIAILNTMYFFLFYDNTIRFTGLVLQLAYPFVFPMAEKLASRFYSR